MKRLIFITSLFLIGISQHVHPFGFYFSSPDASTVVTSTQNFGNNISTNALTTQAALDELNNVSASVPDPLPLSELKAKDSNGLSIKDDGGNLGIFVEDGGDVGIGTNNPVNDFEVVGNVKFFDSLGIGNLTSPSFPFHVLSNNNPMATFQSTVADAFIKLRCGTSGNKTGIQFSEDGLNYKIEYHPDTDTMNFYNYLLSKNVFTLKGGNIGIGNDDPSDWFKIGDSTFTVTDKGNVGIGINNPSKKLQVDGTIDSHQQANVVASRFVFKEPWITRTSAGNYWWNSIAWSQKLGLYAAVSESGTVMISSDSVTWDLISAPNRAWQAIVWSPERELFVAVGATGTGDRVMTSPDGINWTLRTSAADNIWSSIAWSPERGLFVAVAKSGTGDRVMTSPDGITWTSRASPADNSWSSIVWAAKLAKFVAVANSGTGDRVMTSPDGITWTLRTSAADNSWNSIAWSPERGRLVAVSATGASNRVMTSEDAITWTLRTSAADNSWTYIIWIPELGKYVAVAASGTGNRIMQSDDGITWTIKTSPADDLWKSIAWSPELGVLVSVSATTTDNKIMSSVSSKQAPFQTTPFSVGIDQFHINKDGNVGIGIPNPSTKLEIAGTVQLVADGSPIVEIRSKNGNVTAIDLSSGTEDFGGRLLYTPTLDELSVEGANFNVKNGLKTSGPRIKNVATIGTAGYTLQTTDEILNATYTITGSVTITIPTSQNAIGREFLVYDGGNFAGTNNIIVQKEDTTQIERINYNAGASRIYCVDGTNWVGIDITPQLANRIIVNSVNDLLPFVVGSSIKPPPNTEFVVNGIIPHAYTIEPSSPTGSCIWRAMSQGLHGFQWLGTSGALFSGTIALGSFLGIENGLLAFSVFGNDLYDIDSSLNTGTLRAELLIAAGFENGGTVKNLGQFTSKECLLVGSPPILLPGATDGIRIEGVGSIDLDGNVWNLNQNVSGGTFFTIVNDPTNPTTLVDITRNRVFNQSNEFFLNMQGDIQNVNIDKNKVTIKQNFFAPGSKNQTDPSITVVNNAGIKDSTVKIQGSFTETPYTITTFPAQFARVILNANNKWIFDNEERITSISSGVITYTGLESVDVICDGNFVLNPNGTNKALRLQFCKLISVVKTTVTFNSATDRVNDVNTPLQDNDTIAFFYSTSTMPSPLLKDGVYYVVNKLTDSFQLSYTMGGSPIDITTDGTVSTYVEAVFEGGIAQNTITDALQFIPQALISLETGYEIVPVVWMDSTPVVDVYSPYSYFRVRK